MGDKELPITYTGIRPGEKIHEIMVSEEECFRTIERNGYYVILPVLPELRGRRNIDAGSRRANIRRRTTTFRSTN